MTTSRTRPSALIALAVAAATLTACSAAVSPTTAESGRSTAPTTAPAPTSSSPAATAEPSETTTSETTTSAPSADGSAQFTDVAADLARPGDERGLLLGGDDKVLAAVASTPGKKGDTRDLMLAVSTDNGSTWRWAGTMATAGQRDYVRQILVSGGDIVVLGFAGQHDSDGADVTPTIWLATAPDYKPRAVPPPANVRGNNAHIVAAELLNDDVVVYANEVGSRNGYREDYLVAWSSDGKGGWTRHKVPVNLPDLAIRDSLIASDGTIHLVGASWSDKDKSYRPAWISSNDSGGTWTVHSSPEFADPGDDGLTQVVEGPDGRLAFLGFHATKKPGASGDNDSDYTDYVTTVWTAAPGEPMTRLPLQHDSADPLEGEFLNGLLYESGDLIGYGSADGKEYSDVGQFWTIGDDGTVSDGVTITADGRPLHLSDVVMSGGRAVALGDIDNAPDGGVDLAIWTADKPDA